MFSIPKEDCVGTEEYYYINDTPLNSCFNVILAGTTSPSKDYFIHHPKSKIWVFEYVLSGKGHIVTENETFEVKAGDFYIIPEDTNCYYYADKNSPFEKIWINLTGNLVRHIVCDYGINNNNNNNVTIIQYDVSEFFYKMFNILKQKSLNSIFLQLNFHEMIAKVSPVLKAKSEWSEYGIIEKVHDYILDNLFENLDIEKICKEFYISRVHLSQIFKKKYGCSPYKFYTNSKLHMAANLLANSNIPIKEIALSLSYSDTHHFSNVFNKYYGCSPREYRKTSQQKKPN